MRAEQKSYIKIGYISIVNYISTLETHMNDKTPSRALGFPYGRKSSGAKNSMVF